MDNINFWFPLSDIIQIMKPLSIYLDKFQKDIASLDLIIPFAFEIHSLIKSKINIYGQK